jgi:hypothetical protein
MSTFTESIIETFHVVACYTCGVRFGITRELYNRAVRDATGSVHCPACGKMMCWIESDAQRKIKELENKLLWEAGEVSRQKEAREAVEKSLHATMGVVTRLKRRIGSGTCPCCKRTFRQLAAHIANKHPGFGS